MEVAYRSDVLGSLIRPPALVRARAALHAGELSLAEFKVFEDRAVDQAIALQEGAGLDVVTDGEMRRLAFTDHLRASVEGVAPGSGDVTPTFHGATDEAVMPGMGVVVDRLRRRRMLTPEEFTYARARARRPVKVTLPSPLLVYPMWSSDRSREAYRDIFELFRDGAGLIREEAQELAALGCTYIQVDAPDLGTLVDPAHRQRVATIGMTAERMLSEGIEIVNSIADVPGVTFGLHLCRGNQGARWIGRGDYDQIAEAVFQKASNYDVLLLEYDDERSGSFEALRRVPDDKVVVLGLVSTKRADLESRELMEARVAEAARHFPRDQLAISTQCGFSPGVTGKSPASEETQQAKLGLVAEVARRVWG
ncbi:MAG: cobalamin-independent methionine synthase II family protein [Candidatus Dormibacteraeota bacterium]|nr:cobalamin-independent methionine synthase II family protein [Candidatus Dormibacteraeota bacterium]